jgi:DNA repair exonuclease SbcCD ATPase subunit
MKRTREEKKARLQAKAEQVIEEYLKWEESNPKPNLTQIEDIILKLRKELGQEMAEMMLEEQGAKTPVPGPACPKCGKEMRYKGQKGNHIESRVGEIEMERGHYYCGECQEGFFPPGSTTGSMG